MENQLFYKEWNANSPDAVVILHGIFGSHTNWKTVADALAQKYRVIVPDLRNHGKSFHSDEMSYEAMAQDILNLLENLKIKSCHLVGHSMGGRIAMALALRQPQYIEKLVIVDVAPKKYSGDFFVKIADALIKLDLKSLTKRSEADKSLMNAIPNTAIRQFLLKNLRSDDKGGFFWEMNLPIIRKWISSEPEFLCNAQFNKPALFLRGGNSDYVLDDDITMVKKYFPNSQLQTIDGAGHWPHSEKTQEFLEALLSFLESHQAT